MLTPDYKPLEFTLVKKSKSKQNLREDLGISGATLAKIAKHDYISLKTIAQICDYLNCDVEDIVTFRNKYPY